MMTTMMMMMMMIIIIIITTRRITALLKEGIYVTHCTPQPLSYVTLLILHGAQHTVRRHVSQSSPLGIL